MITLVTVITLTLRPAFDDEIRMSSKRRVISIVIASVIVPGVRVQARALFTFIIPTLGFGVITVTSVIGPLKKRPKGILAILGSMNPILVFHLVK